MCSHVDENVFCFLLKKTETVANIRNFYMATNIRIECNELELIYCHINDLIASDILAVIEFL